MAGDESPAILNAYPRVSDSVRLRSSARRASFERYQSAPSTAMIKPAMISTHDTFVIRLFSSNSDFEMPINMNPVAAATEPIAVRRIASMFPQLLGL